MAVQRRAAAATARKSGRRRLEGTAMATRTTVAHPPRQARRNLPTPSVRCPPGDVRGRRSDSLRARPEAVPAYSVR
jgi:hypothetical protein